MLHPPHIVYPEDISEFRGINKVEFSWQSVPDAAGYHIILAKDRRFTHIVHEERDVATTSYEIGNLDYGTYFFRISAVSEGGAESRFSDTLSLVIVPPPPKRVPLTMDPEKHREPMPDN